MHSELCSRLQKAVAPSGPIYARMEWEQDLATNSTADGYAARPAAMLERLRALLPAADAPLAPGGALPGPARPDDSPVAPADAVERLRLLALHVVSTSPRDAERDALLAAASITPAHFGPICAGLFYMGCRPAPAAPSRRSASPAAAHATDDAPLPVDRHVPPLRGAREIERDRARSRAPPGVSQERSTPRCLTRCRRMATAGCAAAMSRATAHGRASTLAAGRGATRMTTAPGATRPPKPMATAARWARHRRRCFSCSCSAGCATPRCARRSRRRPRTRPRRSCLARLSSSQRTHSCARCRQRSQMAHS